MRSRIRGTKGIIQSLSIVTWCRVTSVSTSAPHRYLVSIISARKISLLRLCTGYGKTVFFYHHTIIFFSGLVLSDFLLHATAQLRILIIAAFAAFIINSKKQMRTIKSNILWMLGLLPLFMCGCTAASQNTTAVQDAPALPVVTLQAKDTVIQTPYVADIQAMRNIEIRTRVKGFLEKIYVDEGQSVKKGQLLFKINDEEYRVQLSKAKAALDNAIAAAKATELEADRIKLLVDKKVVAKSELDVALTRLKADRATIEEARTSVQSAENHMAYTSIRAPFDGILDRIPLKAGSLLEEGALLTDLSDISSMYAYFSFPENEYLKYERSKSSKNGNQLVQLVLADGSSYPHKGRIETVEGQIEQTTGSIDFRATFPNPQKLLRHGATAKLYLPSAVNNAVLVPQQAVFDIQDKNYVYIVDAQNKLHMKSFVPQTRLEHCYVVKDGLKPGERILFEGTQKAHDGMIIKPVQAGTKVLAMNN